MSGDDVHLRAYLMKFPLKTTEFYLEERVIEPIVSYWYWLLREVNWAIPTFSLARWIIYILRPSAFTLPLSQSRFRPTNARFLLDGVFNPYGI